MSQKWSGTFYVYVRGAKGLKDADLLGKSDPYCVMSVLAQDGRILYTAKTHTIKNTLDPIWKATFLKHMNGSGAVKIQLDVFDEDDLGKNDFLGRVTHDLFPQTFFEQDHTKELRKKDSNKPTRGVLTFSLTFVADVYADKMERKKGHKSVLTEEGKAVKVVLGPVLLFRGIDLKKNEYKLAILVLIEGEGGDSSILKISPATTDGISVAKILTFKNKNLWRYTFSLPRFVERHTAKYNFNGKRYEFEVPGIEESPRSLFISCNGFHETPKELANDPHHMWKKIIANHREMKQMTGGYHLLIQGGDQVYADPIFHTVDLLKENNLLAGDDAVVNLPTSEHFCDQVETYYMELYMKSWSNEYLAEGLATIPSVMMWDDHDIFDGWGSYAPEIMHCPIYKFIGDTADKYFSAFQLGATQNELKEKSLFSSLQGNHTGKTQVFRIDKLGVVCLDLRTERLVNRVCTKETYDCFIKWMEDNSDIDNLYLVLSIPIVYNDFDILEKAIESTGLGKELEDDLKDHWRTLAHRNERTELIKQLLTTASKGKFRITILSGDVHIGCAGIIYDKNLRKKTNAATMYSLISSAVVNVPPPPSVVSVLELTGNEIETIALDPQWEIKAGLLRFLHDSRQTRYIPGRNFLELLTNKRKGILCRWYSEGQESNPYELYIHPFAEKQGLEIHLIKEDWNFISQAVQSFFGKSKPSKQEVESWKKK